MTIFFKKINCFFKHKMIKKRRLAVLAQEEKWYDTFLTDHFLENDDQNQFGLASPSINAVANKTLNTVAMGNGPRERKGIRISMTSLIVRGTIFVQPQAEPENSIWNPWFMVAIVLDTQCPGTNLRSQDVFDNHSTKVSLSPWSFMNMRFTPRFKVLSKVMLTAGSRSITVYRDAQNPDLELATGWKSSFEMIVELNGLVTNYIDTGVAREDIADIVDNSLNLICFASNKMDQPVLEYLSRLRFVG